MGDKIKILDECKDFAGKIDKKALVGAVGVMLLSWLGLPIVYWLLVREKKPAAPAKKEEKK